MSETVNKMLGLVKDPRKLLTRFLRSTFMSLPDDSYLRMLYWVNFGRKLNLQSPKTFNEKLNWLKLYDRNPLYTKMADKYEVKRFVSDVIGEEYVVHNYGVWNKMFHIF